MYILNLKKLENKYKESKKEFLIYKEEKKKKFLKDVV
jgi:hypothetical protein